MKKKIRIELEIDDDCVNVCEFFRSGSGGHGGNYPDHCVLFGGDVEGDIWSELTKRAPGCIRGDKN